MIFIDMTVVLLKIVSLPHKSSNGTTYIMVFPYFPIGFLRSLHDICIYFSIFSHDNIWGNFNLNHMSHHYFSP
jgi:hypothetical protein